MNTELREFFPFQQVVFDKAKEHTRLPLFLEQRLGKTIITIRWLKYHQAKKVLIVCPKSVISVWENEIRQEAEEPDNFPVFYFTNKQRPYQEFFQGLNCWIIANYEEVVNGDLLGDGWNWDAIILDESTAIRRPGTKRYNYFSRDFGDKFPLRAVLSGLPAPESALDFFNQFRFLDGHMFGMDSWYTFKRSFSAYVPKSQLPTRTNDRYVKQFVQKRGVCLSRQQAQIDNTKLYQVRKCKFSPENRKTYDMIESSYEFGEKQTNWSLVAQGWLHQYAGGLTKFTDEKMPPILYSTHKLDLLIDTIQDEFLNTSVVICARFVAELQHIQIALAKKLKLKSELLYGKTPFDDRSRIIKEFQSGKNRIILAQQKVLRFGINLSYANTMIYFSNSWENEDRQQSEDRLVLIGKHEPLQYIDLITEDTIDEDIVEALRIKRMRSKLPQSFADIIGECYAKRQERKLNKKSISYNLQLT